MSADFWEDVSTTWAEAEQAGTEPAAADPPDLRLRRARLGRTGARIAITGQPGAGKSVLFDALVDRTGPAYQPPGQSHDREKHRLAVARGDQRRRSSVIVVPGQRSNNQAAAFDELLAAGAGPAGIIHVVCWGYNTAWNAGNRATMLDEIRAAGQPVNADTVRAWHRAGELADFRVLADKLATSGALDRLRWLVVAVAKCDLFWSDIAAAREYYIPVPGHPTADSPFGEVLRGLTADGKNDVQLAVLPISSYAAGHDFGVGLPKQPRQFDDAQTTAVRRQFFTVLGRYL
ncbi:hypothetical protein [Fodinicola acaciae]|uniref:hypothetical protein n=1 Tax=Fodinicola acaciae TaxID=2681555 RepID=UPI0013D27B89|nr:hypothetical protein [Fodinicola acaciae]